MKDQIQFETNGLKVLVVPVGNDHYDFKMQESKYLYPGEFVLTYKSPVVWDKYGKESWIWRTKGNWTLHAVTDTITEEQAKVLVERSKGMISGIWPVFHYNMFETAIEAVEDMLISRGIDPNIKHVILIQKK